MTQPPPDNDLLDRYLSNECSYAERMAVDAWAAASPDNALWLAELRHVAADPYETVPFANDVTIRERVWARVDEAPYGDVPLTLLGEDAATPSVQKSQRAMRRPEMRAHFSSHQPAWRRWAGASVAAVVAIAAFVGVVRWTHHVPTPTRVAQTYTTSRGQRASFLLPDGTRVQLAPASQLVVSAGFGRTTRDVELQGEAMFTVAHGTRQPFLVHTRNVQAQVLGTTFDVRGYAEDPAVRVLVRDGRVAVNAVVLGAGDGGQVDVAGTFAALPHDTSAAGRLTWVMGTLTFRDTPLRDVAVQLSRWYDVDFVVSDASVGALPLTTVVRTTAAVDSIMKIISVTTGTMVERHGHTVTISHAVHPAAVPEAVQTELARAGR